MNTPIPATGEIRPNSAHAVAPDPATPALPGAGHTEKFPACQGFGSCPCCEMLKEPGEMLETLQRCFEAIGDLMAAATPERFSIVKPDSLALLLGLIIELQALAAKANFKAFSELSEENQLLRRLAVHAESTEGA